MSLLLTWLVEEPRVYEMIKKYLSADDFTQAPYDKVATSLFADFEKGVCEPAAIISMFQDEDEQRKVAQVFNTKLPPMETVMEREKAIKDLVIAVKKNSYAVFTERLATDVDSLNKVVEGKRALQELVKLHISLE